jgi:hypothetical protein
MFVIPEFLKTMTQNRQYTIFFVLPDLPLKTYSNLCTSRIPYNDDSKIENILFFNTSQIL